MEYISKSEKETHDIANKISRHAKPGDIFALYGDLGSGKTTFSKGFARALGIEKEITSPTFVISKEYVLENKDVKKLIHIDCYRLNSEDDAFTAGISDFFKQKNVIILIEWPENIEEVLPEKVKKIQFEYIDEKTRKIKVSE